MLGRNLSARINAKVLAILILVTIGLGISLVTARQVRRSILSEKSLATAEAAYGKKEWSAAYKHYQDYLARNPDDIEILKKYAEARLSARPLEGGHLMQAIAAYRRVIRLDPLDELSYEKLATIYAGIGNFEDLAYIARTRLEHVPGDRKAVIWLADALIRLNKEEEADQMLTTFMAELRKLPDKHVEYVHACERRSRIAVDTGSPDGKTKALNLLTDAVDYDPQSVEALAHRTWFYRVTPNIPDVNAQEARDRARDDLEAADRLGTEHPRIRLFLASEWMAHGEFDRVAAELQATEGLAQEVLEEYFFDINDWKIAQFLVASELALRTADVAKAASLADGVLASLEERRHRVRVLASAVRVYVAANRIEDARRYLDECLEAQYAPNVPAEFRLTLAYLQALVARAEQQPYRVIDALQPLVMTDTSRPEFWQLLADAYSRTDQPRRAIAALLQYLRYDSENPEMMLQLVKEYGKLRDWGHACEIAQRAEALNPADITLKLLRIEASVLREAEQGRTPNVATLEKLEGELVDLRRDHSHRVDVRLIQAIIADCLGDPDRAESELKLAIEQCIRPLLAEMELVRLYHRTKRIDEAFDACRRACKRHSGVAEPWLALSSLHVARGDHESARRCLREGLETVSEGRERRSILLTLALHELMYSSRPEGLRILSEVAAENQHEIRARTLLLNTREIQGDQAAAQKLIDELKAAEGESGLQWRLHQASLWLSSEDWRSKQQDIISHLQYCIDADPEWSRPPLLLVQMYEKLKDHRRVEDICRQALARNPSATDVADRLVQLLEQQGRLADVEKVLQQTQADSRVASAWNVRLALRARDFSGAIEELKLRVSNDERDVNSRILLARLIYWQTTDAELAWKYLDEAEALAPDALASIWTRVEILRAEGQADKARRILDQYVAKRGDFGAYVIRAAFLAAEGDMEHAEQDYRKLTSFTDRAVAGYELLSDFHIRNKSLDKAVAVLEEGLDAYPDDAELNLELKRRLMRTLFVRRGAEDHTKALAILGELEQRLPDDPELLRLRAVILLQEPALTPQTLRVAREKLESVTRLEPTAADAHLALIAIAMQSEQYEAARDQAIRALASVPNSALLILARSRAEFALGNTRMATDLVRMALEKDPNAIEAARVLLEAAQTSKDPNSLLLEARRLIEPVIARDPADEKVLLVRAHIMISLGQPRAAIPELKAYCETENGSHSVDALVTLADLYRLSGDMRQAWQWVERAERLAPNSQSVVHARFLCLEAQRRFEDLVGISSAYISAREQNAARVLVAASKLITTDSMELRKEGIRLLEHAVSLSPTSVRARTALASSLYQMGRTADAEKIYRELLSQHPNDARILNDLAWILQDRYGDYAKALELADKGLGRAAAPEDPARLHLLDTRGTILSKMPNRLADAKTDFVELVRLVAPDTPQHAKALLQLARVCARLYELDQAKQHLTRAMEIDRRTPVFTTEERAEIADIM